MPIEKLDIMGTDMQEMINTINELIDKFETHYHIAMDTNYNTTLPRYEQDEVDES